VPKVASNASATSAISTAFTLGAVPATLRDELIKALNEVLRNYLERRWEPSELNGGKLCEVVHTILRGHVDGKFPSKASKPQNTVDACKALEQADSKKFPRSVRIQIPRMLVALYEIRNNRGVGHVGGDVDPNLMDATAVVAMSKWIVAELIRVFHAVSTERAQEFVESVVERSLPVVWKVGDVVRVLKSDMGAKDKVLVLLYHSRTWVSEEDLRRWVEYSNPSIFRKILLRCHKEKMVEYNTQKKRITISPTGIEYVESHILLEL
jgi:hypothetical protein